MIGLVLAAVVVTGGDGVPDTVANEARAVLERLLEGVDAEVTLRLFRTRAAMEAAVPGQSSDFAAYYDYKTRTIFAYLAPRPTAGMSGQLLGALAHEAQHARGALLEKGYGSRPLARIEGEADRDALRFLDTCGLAGAGAWRLMLESRWQRLIAMGPAPDGPLPSPRSLAPAQRAAWYTWAYVRAAGRAKETPKLPWVWWGGGAAPIDGGYRLVAGPRRAALLVREAPGKLAVDVIPGRAGRGQIELLFGFRGLGDYAKVAFLRKGGVRAMFRRGGKWTKEALYPAPPLLPGRRYRLELDGGIVRLDGRDVLYVRRSKGKVGVGVWDAAADFITSSS